MPDSEFGSDGQLRSNPEPFEETSAADRLRAFEDEHVGEDAPRINGALEQGHGSLFQRLSPAHRKAHAAIEKTVETEHKLAKARAALAVAENEHAAALKAADDVEIIEPDVVDHDLSRDGSG